MGQQVVSLPQPCNDKQMPKKTKALDETYLVYNIYTGTSKTRFYKLPAAIFKFSKKENMIWKIWIAASPVKHWFEVVEWHFEAEGHERFNEFVLNQGDFSLRETVVVASRLLPVLKSVNEVCQKRSWDWEGGSLVQRRHVVSQYVWESNDAEVRLGSQGRVTPGNNRQQWVGGNASRDGCVKVAQPVNQGRL